MLAGGRQQCRQARAEACTTRLPPTARMELRLQVNTQPGLEGSPQLSPHWALHSTPARHLSEALFSLPYHCTGTFSPTGALLLPPRPPAIPSPWSSTCPHA